MLSDKRIKRYLSMAKSASELSDYIHNKVGCIFVYKKDIVAVGYNHKVTSPLQKKYNKYRVSKNGRIYDVNKQKNYIHAEADALIRASKRLTDDELKECKVFIYRQTKSGIMGLSRCCNACYKMLEDVGIKEIYYSKDVKGYGHEVITECGYGNVDLLDGKPHNYCSNCGSFMMKNEGTLNYADQDTMMSAT